MGMGNQPRMHEPSSATDGKTIRFRFVDITNLKPGTDHIKHLTVTIDDANHLTQEWTSEDKGKEEAAVVKWTRRKSQ
jgi:hypothetical protein